MHKLFIKAFAFFIFIASIIIDKFHEEVGHLELHSEVGLFLEVCFSSQNTASILIIFCEKLHHTYTIDWIWTL